MNLDLIDSSNRTGPCVGRNNQICDERDFYCAIAMQSENGNSHEFLPHSTGYLMKVLSSNYSR
jgi:hypothetical protein